MRVDDTSIFKTGRPARYELLFAHITDIEVQLSIDLSISIFRDANATWLGEGLDPSCDIDAVAVDIALVDDDVTDIDRDGTP